MVYVYIFSRLSPGSPTSIPNNEGELENALGTFRNESPSSLWRTRAKKMTGGTSTVYGVSQGIYKNIRAHPSQGQVLQDGRREFGTLAANNAMYADTDTERTRNHLGLPDANAIDDSSNQNHSRRKIQDKLDNIYISTGHSYDGDLWELSDYVPQWMKGKVLYCDWLAHTNLMLLLLFQTLTTFVLFWMQLHGTRVFCLAQTSTQNTQ
jgi:hypothetical protein